MKKIGLILLLVISLFLVAGCKSTSNYNTGEITTNIQDKVTKTKDAQQILNQVVKEKDEETFTLTPKAIHEEKDYEKYGYSNGHNKRDKLIQGDIQVSRADGKLKSISVGGSTTSIEELYELIQNTLQMDILGLKQDKIQEIVSKIKASKEDDLLTEDIANIHYTYTQSDGVALFLISLGKTE